MIKSEVMTVRYHRTNDVHYTPYLQQIIVAKLHHTQSQYQYVILNEFKEFADNLQNAFKKAINLFNDIDTSSCESADFEEMKLKLKNCHYYMNHQYIVDVQSIKEYICSRVVDENKFSPIVEVIKGYNKITLRKYMSERTNKIDQVSRLCTWVMEALRDFELTADIRDKHIYQSKLFYKDSLLYDLSPVVDTKVKIDYKLVCA